jgi:hypothetical protein
MAGTGTRLFLSGEVAYASDINTYLMDQVIAKFADEEERTLAFGDGYGITQTNPETGLPGTGKPKLLPGQFSYLLDTNDVQYYNGSIWQSSDQFSIGDGTVDTPKLAPSLTLTTPNIGVATATSVNKVTVTQPATGATLTLADGSTLQVTGAFPININASASTSVTLPASGTLSTLAGGETLTNKTLTSPVMTSPTVSGLSLSDSSIVFEGSSADDFETTLTVVNPTSDRTITVPNISGTLVTTGDTSSVSNTMINYSSVPQQTVSTGNPTGGKQHDIWIKVPAT